MRLGIRFSSRVPGPSAPFMPRAAASCVLPRAFRDGGDFGSPGPEERRLMRTLDPPCSPDLARRAARGCDWLLACCTAGSIVFTLQSLCSMAKGGHHQTDSAALIWCVQDSPGVLACTSQHISMAVAVATRILRVGMHRNPRSERYMPA